MVKKVDLENHIISNEISRHIPLTSIAVTETFFRLSYQDIIDLGDPYLTNSIQYMKEMNVRFDMDFLSALNGKKVTVGEILSHQLQLNNLNDITHTLSKLLGDDFLKLLKSAKYSNSILFHDKREDFKKNFGAYIESVNKMFDYRHIFAHEFALNVHIDVKTLLEDFKRLYYFLTCSNHVIATVLGENLGVGTYETQFIAQKQFKKAEVRLNKLIKSVKFIDDSSYGNIGDKKKFNKAIEEWKKFRNSYSQAITASYQGGTISSFIFWSEMERMTLQMETNLRDNFRRQLRASNLS